MSKINLGWIGCGVMGKSMALNLSKNYNVFVYNRTKEKAISTGLSVCSSIKELVNKCDIICTMVGFVSDVEDVYFNHILKENLENKLLIDFTTTSPSLEVEIYNKCKTKKAFFLDSPVSGGDIGAKMGKLSIMVGGDKDVYDKALEVFSFLGTSSYQGLISSGQKTKMANQILISSTMLGLSEALLYAKRSNLDLNLVISTLSLGAASCWSLTNLAPRMLNKNYDPGFFVDHFIKDLTIAKEDAKKMNLNLPSLNLALENYKELSKDNMGKFGTQAIILNLEKHNP